VSVSGRQVGAVGLAATLVAVDVLVLWPTHPNVGWVWRQTDSLFLPLVGLGVPRSLLRVGVFEFASNIVMFLPLGFFGALLLRRDRWWVAALACFALTCAIEATQGLLLPGRSFDVTDIIGNAAGGVIGAAVAWLVRATRASLSAGVRRGVARVR
jgi:glycopeptide antibiotics resistance protein